MAKISDGARTEVEVEAEVKVQATPSTSRNSVYFNNLNTINLSVVAYFLHQTALRTWVLEPPDLQWPT